MRTLVAGVLAAAGVGLAATPAFAWGDAGHQIIGHIAYSLMSPAARARVDAMLAADADPLTKPDFASRAAWADAYRNAGDKKIRYDQTHLWYFTDVELASPNLDQACRGFPALPAGVSASRGPPEDCLTAKLAQFEAELAAPSTPAAERLLALKYVMTMVGDVDMPFHVSDNHDDHGNCLQVRTAPGVEMKQLHHYWDDVVVDDLIAADRKAHPEDVDLSQVGDRLRREITPADAAAWRSGDAKAWTMQTFRIAQTVGYDLPPHPVCTPGMKWADYPPFVIPERYQARALAATRMELQQSGVRLAWVLDHALLPAPRNP
jgi:hypothetical protein